MLYKYQLSLSGLKCHLRSKFPFWFSVQISFHWRNLGVKFPTLTVLLSISFFMVVSIWLTNWSSPVLLFLVVLLLGHVQLFVTPWTVVFQASLSFTVSRSLLKFMSVESVMLSNHLILCLTFFFCLQSFPISEYFSVIQFFASGNQNWVYICIRLLYLLLELIPLSLYCVLLFLILFVLKSILS